MRAWVLNLDADHELAHPHGYAPREPVRARVAALVPRIEGLVPIGDVIVDEHTAAHGMSGRLWCPTPRALALLAQSAAEQPEVPAFDIVRRVNHRAFSAELGQTLEGAAFVRDREALANIVAQRTATGFWLLKRPFGFAGSGRRRVARGALADEAWIAASLRGGGLQVEPWMERRGDFSLHGFLGSDGELTVGAPCLQECDARGQWLRARRALSGELARDEHGLLLAEGERVGRALHEAGYFGPFGIDAYRHRAGFQPRSEINARYTMAWAIGMGEARPDLQVAHREHTAP